MPLSPRTEIRQSFSRAAETYNQAASHQLQVATELVDLLKAHDEQGLISFAEYEKQKSGIVDLGSGTGFVSALLKQRLGFDNALRLDISERMLKQDPGFNTENRFICADLEVLPFKTDSLTLLVSSYACQWAQNHEHLFLELYRVLKPGACVYLSLPGVNTFEELTQAWAEVDDKIHVHEFLPQSELLDSARNKGFECMHFSQTQNTLRFTKQRQALSHIKDIGAHNLDKNRSKQLTAKSEYFAFSKAFKEKSKIKDAYSLSYQNYFFAFRK